MKETAEEFFKCLAGAAVVEALFLVIYILSSL